MNDDEIIRWLRRFRYDLRYKREQRVPLSGVAWLANCSRQTVYMIMLRRYPVSGQIRDRLTYAINTIRSGVYFKRIDRVWTVHPGEQEDGNADVGMS